MKLKDILPNYPLENIEVRTNNPFGEDMLFGFCSWTVTDLISEDGDSYYLDEEIVKYEPQFSIELCKKKKIIERIENGKL